MNRLAEVFAMLLTILLGIMAMVGIAGGIAFVILAATGFFN